MRTTLRRVSTAFAAGLLVALVIGAPNASAKPNKNIDTSTASSLSEQVRHKLAMLPWYGVFDTLGYEINGSQVILKGEVIGEHAITKNDAAKEVKSIPGVTSVVNEIRVLPASPFDNQIRRAEYRAIFSMPSLSKYSMGVIPQIHIIVDGGHVTLEGTVLNQQDRNVAEISANSVPGVFSVTNNLSVAS